MAATDVAGSLAHAVLGRAVALLVTARRVHDLDADNLLLDRAEEGHVEQVAVRRSTIAVLAEDPRRGAGPDLAGRGVLRGRPWIVLPVVPDAGAARAHREGYCTHCPRVPDSARAHRYLAYLDEIR